MKLLGKVLFFISISLIFTSCASTHFASLQNINKSLPDIQKAILKAFPQGKDVVFEGGRGFLSNSFLFKGGRFVPASNSRLRLRARVEIRGDRRPYSLDIKVYSEKRENGQFKRQRYYRSLAKIMLRRVHKYLFKDQKEKNAVDDFRVF